MSREAKPYMVKKANKKSRMEKLKKSDVGDATSGSTSEVSVELNRSNEEGISNMDRAEDMSPASHHLLRSGGAGTPIIDLTSGDDGSDRETGAISSRAGGDNARGQSNESVATSSRESLPNTPKVNRTIRGIEHPVDLTPNFRFAAAMAGWDDDALLLAAMGVDTPVEVLKRATGKGTPEDPSTASCSDRCGGCNLCRERKRVIRTPGQAATPLSAARRHRRLRRNTANDGCMHPIPMAGLNDEGDKSQAPLKILGGSQQQVSAGDNKKTLESGVKTTTPPVAEKDEKGITLKNEEIQLEKLREELTCVVCLEVCFEPSTTSCGHSFCKSCLQSVFQKCGLRCPKCRQQLRTNSSNGCPINTVLWNTIQLLFPKETAARAEDRKKSSENVEVAATKNTVLVEHPPQLRNSRLVRRPTRPTPWRQLPGVDAQERGRALGRYSSFQRASVLATLESWQPVGDRNARVAVSAAGRARTRRPVSTRIRSPQTLRQEQDDAALAARLQNSYISEAGIQQETLNSYLE